MKPFVYIGDINIDSIANNLSNNNDWNNPYSIIRHSYYAVHSDTHIIPLMWSLESIKFEYTSKSAPKTEYWDKYVDNVFFKELFKKINTYKTGHPIRVMFALLPAQCFIYPHTDTGDSFSINSRIHIPIVTNDKVEFTVGSETIYMKQGEIFEIDNQDMHSDYNNSDKDRIHLILDWHAN